jgi:hypothetical protein
MSNMMPNKKLAYYAEKHGVRDVFAIRLSDEECGSICRTLGAGECTASECGCSIQGLIDVISHDAGYRRRFSDVKGVDKDFIDARIIDHAAEDILEAYKKI